MKKKSNFRKKKEKKAKKKKKGESWEKKIKKCNKKKVKKKRGMYCVSPHHLVVACVLLWAYRNNIYDGIVIVN